MKYVTTTFSPSMLTEIVGAPHLQATIMEMPEEFIVENVSGRVYDADFKMRQFPPAISRVGHQKTAAILSLRWNCKIEFSRENIVLRNGDEVFVAIPQLRFEETREYTSEEIASAKFRFFWVKISYGNFCPGYGDEVK